MISRRKFVEIGGFSLASLVLSGRDLVMAQQSSIKPRSTADACIFVNLVGAPSHVDTFDVKVGPWTPDRLDIRSHPGKIQLSQKLFPELSKATRHLSLVRSVEPWEAEHTRGWYYVNTGHPFNPGFIQEVPHMGAVVALEFALRRGGQLDAFPPFFAFNGSTIGSGFLSSSYEPFATYAYASNISNPQGKERLDKRWSFLERLDRPLRQGTPPQGKPFSDYSNVYFQAKKLSDFPPFEEAFTIADDEHARYGESDFGDACLIAWKLLRANRGARFININLEDWDHHVDIYKEENLPALSKQLDRGIAGLLSDLGKTPSASEKGRTLLDRTLIVMMGEFGRTPGPLNESKGRDHHKGAQSVVFAGGGVRGGRVIGETDRVGDKIVDPGWKEKRSIRMESVAATIYSTLGINWTKAIKETPSGRKYEYLPYSFTGMHTEISELF